MIPEDNAGRWPPVYDFKELGKQIKKLVADGSIFNQFYHLKVDTNEFFQGDVLLLDNNPFYIDKEGDISLLEGEFKHWLILGNTCDLARDSSGTIPHLTHITPIIPIREDIPANLLSDLKKYKLYKKLYLPDWNGGLVHYYIDLTLINSVEKTYLVNHAQIAARLHFKTWLLLHSCLVRYLARDDGRHD